MQGLLLLLVFALLSGAAAPHQHTECPCAEARATDGWCDVCHVGYVASVEIHSRLLHETLDTHGHDLDLDSFHCPACQSAIRRSGFCEEHRVGFVRGQAYFSRLTYLLAKWRAAGFSVPDCPVCRKNAQTFGWCEEHGVGRAGEVVIADPVDFLAAAREIRRVQLAEEAASRCEYCAQAIVTDSECPVHRISYQDGAPIPPRAKPEE